MPRDYYATLDENKEFLGAKGAKLSPPRHLGYGFFAKIDGEAENYKERNGEDVKQTEPVAPAPLKIQLIGSEKGSSYEGCHKPEEIEKKGGEDEEKDYFPCWLASFPHRYNANKFVERVSTEGGF